MLQGKIIAVIGGGREARSDVLGVAEELGRGIAEAGAMLICGGLGGVMEAAGRGAARAGGIVIGVLPGSEKGDANPHVTVPVCTGFGTGRNIIIARTADALVAVGGEYGTLSEIAHGLQLGKPVVGIGSWNISGLLSTATPEGAIRAVGEKLSDGGN